MMREWLSARFHNLPFGTKLRLVIISTACASLLAAATIEYVAQARETRQLMARDLLVLTRLVADSSKAALAFGDTILANETVGSLRSVDNIIAGETYSNTMTRIGAYKRSGQAQEIDWSLNRIVDKEQYRYTSKFLDVAVPIRLDGELIGSVLVRSNLDKYYQALLQQAIIFFLVATGMCLLLLVISRPLERLISAPILKLADTMNKLSQAHVYDYRVQKDTDDEIGTLIDSFNELLEEIHNRDRRLAAHREQIEHLAYFDGVTGLPNRAYARQHLDFMLAAAKRREQTIALLFIDLDHFKDVNDTLGHSAGDALLREVGERIKGALRVEDVVTMIGSALEVTDTGLSKFQSDVVARLGGDEFVVTLGNINCAEDAAVAAQRVLSELARPFDLSGRPRYIGASIGISVFPDDGDDAETLLKHADSAMYHAKSSGRNGFQFFIESINKRAHERMTLEHDLRDAVQRGEFLVVYQPRIDVRSREVISVEALLRWNHPERGLMSPAEFIAVAENNGLIIPIGAFVLREACRQIRQWHEMGLPRFGVSVNLSAAQFRQEDLADSIAQSIDESGLERQFLELEVTESMLMSDIEYGIEVLHDLKRLGISSSIDDFGTGYSSLQRLRHLPVTGLKIDRSFIAEMVADRDTDSIVQATISLAHSLRLKVIGEGVETQAQLARLYAHTCDEVQGFLFSKPLTAEQMPGWLAKWQDKLNARQMAELDKTGSWS